MATIVLSAAGYVYYKETETRPTIQYSEEEIRQTLSKIRPSAVVAVIAEDGNVFTQIDNTSPVCATLKKGATVEIMQDRTALWYKIFDYQTNAVGWIERKYLTIPKDPKTNTESLSKEMIEAFANIMEFESSTPYFVWTDIDRQKTYILKGAKHNWTLLKSFTCATGLNESPTTRGLYTIKTRGEWFYSERLKSGAKYWIKFNGSYLFHSVAMDKDKNISDGVLGERRSSGCVRLGLDDIQWMYKNVGDQTAVFIY